MHRYDVCVFTPLDVLLVLPLELVRLCLALPDDGVSVTLEPARLLAQPGLVFAPKLH